MIVCIHGDASEFCEQNGMIPVAQYIGKIEDYKGDCRILVTDQDMSENEYYYWKGLLLARGVDLISTRYKDDEKVLGVVMYTAQREQERRKQTYGGRQPFGYYRKNGEVQENPAMMAVARRIIELKDAGYTLRAIRDVEGISHPDGRKISTSTIQQIISNRDKYERK
jgi:hypothetical protein